jgi:hypothetical protein
MGFVLIAGLAAFAVYSLVRGDEPSSPELYEFAPIALGVIGVAAVGVALILPHRLASKARARSDEAREEVRAGSIPREVFQGHCLAMAVAEGWGLLGLAFHWMTGKPLTLVAPGVAIILILMSIPTLDKARRALE